MDILKKILAFKEEELVHYKHEVPLTELKDQVRDSAPVISLASALRRPRGPFAVIAELKKRSPSRGVLREDYDPETIATDYESNGATALSVLTDENFFGGHLDHLRGVRSRVEIPLVRKDFLWDPYQVYAAREAGADAVLLIVACLEKSRLEDLHGLAGELALETLVEVHDAAECDLAASIGLPIIGVNNRDLKTFEVEVATSEQLFPRMPEGTLKVSESGLDKRATLERLQKAGADAFLIGEAFMKASEPGQALKEMIGS